MLQCISVLMQCASSLSLFQAGVAYAGCRPTAFGTAGLAGMIGWRPASVPLQALSLGASLGAGSMEAWQANPGVLEMKLMVLQQQESPHVCWREPSSGSKRKDRFSQ